MLIAISVMLGLMLVIMWVGVCILDDIRSQHGFDEFFMDKEEPKQRKTRSDKGTKRSRSAKRS